MKTDFFLVLLLVIVGLSALGAILGLIFLVFTFLLLELNPFVWPLTMQFIYLLLSIYITFGFYRIIRKGYTQIKNGE